MKCGRNMEFPGSSVQPHDRMVSRQGGERFDGEKQPDYPVTGV